MGEQRHGHDARASFGMVRGSVHGRRRALRAVRAMTTLSATGVVLGTGYLTAALVPASHAAGNGPVPAPSTAPSAAVSLPGAGPSATQAPVPHSLLSTKKAHPTRATPAVKTHHTKTLARPAVTVDPTHIRQPVVTQAPAPAVSQVPTRAPRPVVTSGGS